MAETTKKVQIIHTKDFQTNKSSTAIFLEHTDKEKIANIIFSLNSKKASGPNSIP